MAKVNKIFTKKNSEGVKTSKFVGAHVPANLFTYLSLYVIVNGTSKTEVLKDVLEEWFQDVSTTQASQKDLLKEVVKYILVPKWEESKLSKVLVPKWKESKLSKDKFIIQSREELKKQGFNDSLISNLIKLFIHDTKE